MSHDLHLNYTSVTCNMFDIADLTVGVYRERLFIYIIFYWSGPLLVLCWSF